MASVVPVPGCNPRSIGRDIPGVGGIDGDARFGMATAGQLQAERDANIVLRCKTLVAPNDLDVAQIGSPGVVGLIGRIAAVGIQAQGTMITIDVRQLHIDAPVRIKRVVQPQGQIIVAGVFLDLLRIARARSPSGSR